MLGGLGLRADPLSSLGMHGVSRERICCPTDPLLSPLSLIDSFSISSLGLCSGAQVFVLAKEESSDLRKGCQKLPGGVWGLSIIGHCHLGYLVL